jgi:hypothetical protein
MTPTRQLPRKTSIRILLLTILFTIGLTAFILFINSRERLVQGQGFGFGVNDLQEVISAFQPQEDAIELMMLMTSFELTPPSGAGYQGSNVRIRLDDFGYYVFDGDETQDADTLCLDSLRIGMETTYENAGSILVGVDMLEGTDPLCGALGEAIEGDEGDVYLQASSLNPSTRDLFENLYIDFAVSNPFFRYPYDQFGQVGTIQASYRILSGETVIAENETMPFPVWLYNTSGERNWNIKLSSEEAVKNSPEDTPSDFYGFLNNGQYRRVTMSFERPLLFRLAYPFLILAVLVMIGLLPFIKPFHDMLANTAALLFGIFGLRQVMLPPDSQGQTILDVLFIGLYVVLAFTLILIIIARTFSPKPPHHGSETEAEPHNP